MLKETPWLKLFGVPCHCSMYPLGTIIITIIMNSQFYCQNWDLRERERSQTWLTILVHATINDRERNSNECRNIRPQQKAKKNALETFTKFLIKMGNAEIQNVIVKEEPLHALSSSSSRWIVKALKICDMKFLKTAAA